MAPALRIGLLGDVVGSDDSPGLAAGIRGAIGEVDLFVANLEAAITPAVEVREAKTYNLRNPASLLRAFDRPTVVGLANNHIMDFSAAGLDDTLRELSARGVAFAGAGCDLEEASRPAVVECAGTRIALLAAADPRYQAAGESSAGTCPADAALLRQRLGELRARADLAVVTVHMGMEFVPVPTPAMRRLAETCLDAGARVVAFHHSHCLSGCSTDARGAVLWGLGNFAFPYVLPRPYRPWSQAAVWLVRVEAEGGPPAVEIRPVVIDERGAPRPAAGAQAAAIRARVDRWSRRIARGHDARWRLLSMLSPEYAPLALANYVEMARRSGVTAVLRQTRSTLGLHKGSGRS